MKMHYISYRVKITLLKKALSIEPSCITYHIISIVALIVRWHNVCVKFVNISVAMPTVSIVQCASQTIYPLSDI